jgi:hypothetical protein
MLLAACGGRYEPIENIDHASFRARAAVETDERVTVAAAIPDEAEALAIFGVDLDSKGIQPIWLEIENGSERPFVFLPSGLDAEYFAPNETSFLFASQFDRESRRTLGAFLEEASLTNRAPIAPGETARGFVFVNKSEPTAIVDVVLVGSNWSKTIPLFLPVPGAGGIIERDDILERFASTGIEQAFDDREALRRALERLPCHTNIVDGDSLGPPVNLVIVGELDVVAPAFGRRLYRLTEVEPLRLFGRNQDLASVKTSRWTAARPHLLRLWITDLSHRGLPVMVGQVSMPRGGRFAATGEPRHSAEARTDDARDGLLQDMFYSQSLAKVAFVKARGPEPLSGCATASGFETDGLRAVLFFHDTESSLAEIVFLDWERLRDHRE